MRPSWLQTELVALRIDQDDEFLRLVNDRGPERQQPVNLTTKSAHSPQIEVLTIFRGLPFWNILEPQRRASPSRRFHPGTLVRAVLVNVRSERRCPERGDDERVLAIEGDGLDEATTV